MKIITDTAAYVQKGDLYYLDSVEIPKTRSIYLSVFDWGKTRLTKENQYDFYKYDKKEDIEFFKNIDWMVDYDEVKDCSDEELIKLGKAINEERVEIGERFNNMSIKERMKNPDLQLRHRLLAHKIHTLTDFIMYKRGQIDFDLPEDFKIEREINNEERKNILNK